MPRFHVLVAHDYLRFCAAHFIAFPGFREPLHGHNYQLTVAVSGPLGPDGFVLDFCVVQDIAKRLCGELHDRVLLPGRSDALQLTADETSVALVAEDGARFLFPRADVQILPIVHTSAEEIAAHLLTRFREGLQVAIAGRGPLEIEVSVAEAPGQVAHCRAAL